MTHFFTNIHVLLLTLATALLLGMDLVGIIFQKARLFFSKGATPSETCHGCHCASAVIVVQVNEASVTNSIEIPKGLREQWNQIQTAIEALQKIIPTLPANMPLHMDACNVLTELREHQDRLEGALVALEGSLPEKRDHALESAANPRRGRIASTETKKRISEGLKRSRAARKKAS